MKFNNRTIRLCFLDEIEDAVKIGWNRAYKHIDNPDEDTIKSHIYDAVESAIYEWIDFDFGDVE